MEIHETPEGDEETLTPDAEERKDYSDDDRKDMAKSGEALPDGSYPIKNKADLQNAIHAVGRGNADHSAIRKHIISRAKALGAEDMIPDNWQADGSLKQQNKALIAAGERRRKDRHRAVPLMPEVRHFRAEGLEVRENSKTNELLVSGEPIVYATDYTVTDALGQFTERMAPGVAQDVLPKADVRFLFNHDGLPLARTTSGTMSLQDSDSGLRFTASLDARQQLSNDLAIAIERGDVSQMSCGFIVAQDEWSDDWEDRTIQRFAELLDVSAVTYPASPSTSIGIAQRMMLQAPVESRARIRKAYVDIRAGKVLSSANQDKLVSALSALHDLAGSGGVDLSQIDPDNDGDAPDVNVSDDATMGGNDTAESGVGADGFPVDQTRSAEPGEPITFHRSEVAVDQAWITQFVQPVEERHGEARKRAA